MQQRHVVQEGDTLWDLADQYLGSNLEWSRIYRHNNRPSVVRITGKNIADPDLIYPGQTLLIPTLPGQANLPKKRHRKEKVRPIRLKDRVNTTYVPFATSYKLDDLPVLEYESFGVPAFKATIKFSGDVAVRLADKIPLSYVSNKGLEVSYKRQADSVMDRLLSEAHVEWDKASNQIKYSCNLVTLSPTNNGPSTTIGISVSSDKPVPVIKGEFVYPELKGYLDRDFYCAMNVKVVIEIEPRVPAMVRSPRPETVNDLQYARPSHNQTASPQINWALVGTGFAMLAATIIADFLTGVSVADDFVTIPIALRTMASGLIIFGATPSEVMADEPMRCIKSH